MSRLDAVRNEISSIIADIELIPRELRDAARQEDDCEAYEIVRRIEQRIARDKANGVVNAAK